MIFKMYLYSFLICSESDCYLDFVSYLNKITLNIVREAVNNGTVIVWGLARGILQHHRLVSRHPQGEMG